MIKQIQIQYRDPSNNNKRSIRERTNNRSVSCNWSTFPQFITVTLRMKSTTINQLGNSAIRQRPYNLIKSNLPFYSHYHRLMEFRTKRHFSLYIGIYKNKFPLLDSYCTASLEYAKSPSYGCDLRITFRTCLYKWKNRCPADRPIRTACPCHRL